MIKNLMIIDDDEDDREILSSILEEGYPHISLSIAANGQVGLRQLQSEPVYPDLIFLDLNMPIMGGKQFMEEISKDNRLRDIPVAVLTTSSDAKTIAEMKSLGVTHFLTKPDRYKEWKEMLQVIFINGNNED